MSTLLPILPINEDKMNEMVLANRAGNWRRLKALVLDNVFSPITKQVYSLDLDEFLRVARPSGSIARMNSEVSCLLAQRCRYSNFGTAAMRRFV